MPESVNRWSSGLGVALSDGMAPGYGVVSNHSEKSSG